MMMLYSTVLRQKGRGEWAYVCHSLAFQKIKPHLQRLWPNVHLVASIGERLPEYSFN